MTEEFELIFAIPESEHDACALSDAVFEAGFEDALVGIGRVGMLGVKLETEGDDAESILKTEQGSASASLQPVSGHKLVSGGPCCLQGQYSANNE
ncbi:hypothetical protein [uncultured Cohaesibacter sp.]|uniref:hypothetical protein n=1 Tax=uncultured Cohaesibacter sp. TaxID=1002546 RepID=UPI002AA768C6|nr:hypothetical protein [uncultured Cohaesibacter sp.]